MLSSRLDTVDASTRAYSGFFGLQFAKQVLAGRVPQRRGVHCLSSWFLKPQNKPDGVRAVPARKVLQVSAAYTLHGIGML